MNLSKEIESIYLDMVKFSKFLVNGSQNHYIDLINDTIVRIYEKQDKYDENKINNQNSFKYWAFQVMKNLYFDQIRKYKKMQEIIPNIDYIGINDIEKKYDDIYRNSVITWLIDHIEKIDYAFQPILKLRMKGLKYIEISNKLNIPMGTVRGYINRARKYYSQYKKLIV